MSGWKSRNRHKYLLQYHLIFVCKYRKKLLGAASISEDIKQFSCEICLKHNVAIKRMEPDKDHIHYMIETRPTTRLSDLYQRKHKFAKLAQSSVGIICDT